MTSLTYATNETDVANNVLIALTYAYDRNGDKTASTEKGTLDWGIPPLTDEIARYTASGRLIDRTIRTNAPGVIPSPGGEGRGALPLQ